MALTFPEYLDMDKKLNLNPKNNWSNKDEYFRYGGEFQDNKFGFIGFHAKEENHRGQYLMASF